MLTALVRLRGALQSAVLPAGAARGGRAGAPSQREMVDQLEDYVIPRVMTLDAPLLAVVGGSTGAGKSTLVNSLVGRRVTEPGVLRPTTRSPVLVHNPADAGWFGQDRLLPDLERVAPPHQRPRRAPARGARDVPPGLAILDAPDVDSVRGAQPHRSPPSCWPPPTSGSSSPPPPATPTRCRGTSCARPPSARPPWRSCSTGRRPTPSTPSPPTWPGCWPPAASRTRRCSPSTRAPVDERGAAAGRVGRGHPRLAERPGRRRRRPGPPS